MSKHGVGEKTKTKIINAAGMLAAELGFDNVSTRMIAERSGENIGSIHYHFGGKDALFEAVVRAIISANSPLMDEMDVKILDEEHVTPHLLSKFIRKHMHFLIDKMFLSGNPLWHCQVIYQLLQFKGELYDIFEREVVVPQDAIRLKLFRLVYPDISKEEAELRGLIMITPVVAHANYMSTILRQLGRKSYSPEYLQMLEDLIVRQTQLLMGLPEEISDIQE